LEADNGTSAGPANPATINDTEFVAFVGSK
jgi:hypothetical protein